MNRVFAIILSGLYLLYHWKKYIILYFLSDFCWRCSTDLSLNHGSKCTDMLLEKFKIFFMFTFAIFFRSFCFSFLCILLPTPFHEKKISKSYYISGFTSYFTFTHGCFLLIQTQCYSLHVTSFDLLNYNQLWIRWNFLNKYFYLGSQYMFHLFTSMLTHHFQTLYHLGVSMKHLNTFLFPLRYISFFFNAID